MDKRPVICLAGSMKFFGKMVDLASSLSQSGHIVLMPFKDGRDMIPDDEREKYRELQRDRILMADQLYVVNQDGYIGVDTMEEIQFAAANGKTVEYLELPKKPYVVTLIGSRKFIEQFKTLYMELSLKGYIVHVPAIFYTDDPSRFTNEEHRVLDILHRQKMIMSDEVIVINPDNYIGTDTREEIQFAEANNLNISYTVSPTERDGVNAGC